MSEDDDLHTHVCYNKPYLTEDDDLHTHVCYNKPNLTPTGLYYQLV